MTTIGRRGLRRGVAGAAALLVLTVLSPGRLPAQAPPSKAPAKDGQAPGSAQAAFPVGLDQVTVDVVVANRKGDPVAGLTEKDFTILEDGKPQKVVSFDVIRRPAPSVEGKAAAGANPAAVVTNMGSGEGRGRTFVVVFDTLHLSPLGARSAKSAVASFLEKGTRADDGVMLVATGENFWWNSPSGSRRDDLLAVLKGLEGRRIPETAGDRLTDYEAVQITVYRDVNAARRVQERFERYGGTARTNMQQAQQEYQAQGMIDMYVDQRALEQYLKIRNRLEVTFDQLERAFKALASNRDRKALILVSDGFVYDPSNHRLKGVTEAARRANAAVYFIDTRGLEGLSQYFSAEFGAVTPDPDRMAAIADVGRDGDGSEALARETGGFAVRDTNDFSTGIVRIGRESETYYLLGYVPAARSLDGRFHKIDVRVPGKGLVVRARKGYYDAGGAAPVPSPVAASADSSKGDAPPADSSKSPPTIEKTDADIQRALDSPDLLNTIPLRIAAYRLRPTIGGKVQVVLAADSDVSKIAFGEATGNAVLDTLLIVAQANGSVDRADRKVELQRRATPPRGGPIWYSFLRDFELGQGRYQAKLVVRDATTRTIGTVSLTFDVPSMDALHLSTPVLTDSLTRDGAGGLAPALLARRDFRSDAQLYCQFDVFGAAKGPDGLPRVRAGHELRRRGGAVVGRTDPTPLTPTSLGALSRIIQIPLSVATPGEYDLVLAVRDEISGKQVEKVESFEVTAPPGD